MTTDTKTPSPLIPVILSKDKHPTSATPTPRLVPRNSDLVAKGTQIPLSVQIKQIPADNIIPNRYQPRKSFNYNSLARLADSIRRHGILQPITVRTIPANSVSASSGSPKYEIICGERRYRAGLMAGLDSFRCIVADQDDLAAAELSVIENLLRDDLNIFEQAEAFELLISTFNLTQQQVASRVCMSQSAVANKIRLLNLTPPERAAILENSLTERHARALLRLSDSKLRLKFIELIVRDKLNVSAAEQLIDNYIKYTSEHAANEQEPRQNDQHPKNITGIFKDVKVFSNSIEKAADVLRKSGIFVETTCADTNDTYIYTIKISKSNVSRETSRV